VEQCPPRVEDSGENYVVRLRKRLCGARVKENVAFRSGKQISNRM
jgi:hypothetical protein